MIRIPTDPDTPLYEQRVTLDEADYILLFDYSQREDRFYLTISTLEGVVIVRGIKLVTGVWIGPRVANRLIFPGALTVETNHKDRSPPGMGELGEDRRCQLYYFTQEDLIAG